MKHLARIGTALVAAFILPFASAQAAKHTTVKPTPTTASVAPVQKTAPAASAPSTVKGSALEINPYEALILTDAIKDLRYLQLQSTDNKKAQAEDKAQGDYLDQQVQQWEKAFDSVVAQIKEKHHFGPDVVFDPKNLVFVRASAGAVGTPGAAVTAPAAAPLASTPPATPPPAK